MGGRKSVLLCMFRAAAALARSIHRAAAGGVGGHYAVAEGEFDILGNCRSMATRSIATS